MRKLPLSVEHPKVEFSGENQRPGGLNEEVAIHRV